MRIAILTNFDQFHPGYSLTSLVSDQVTMLAKYGHNVQLFVARSYTDDIWPSPENCTIKRIVPNDNLVDYHDVYDLSAEHEEMAHKLSGLLVQELKDVDVVITHDWLLTGWNLPYFLALKASRDETRQCRFLHFIHSIPTARYNWWSIKVLGNNHRLVYPNKSDSLLVVESYGGSPDSVRVIPHIRDLRTIFEFHEDSRSFIDEYPGIMDASIVQVYPASSDRLEPKRVRELILLFKLFKERRRSICLVIANQWATGRRRMEDIEEYKRIAYRNGLTDREFIFTSEFMAPKFDTGLPRRMLRELMMCANLFVFPTREETFGLVLPEASLASGCLTVCNRDLDVLLEVAGHNGLFTGFGSYFRNRKIEDEKAYFASMADLILSRMNQDDGVRTRSHMRRTYNMDAIYRNYYAPTFAEARVLWTT